MLTSDSSNFNQGRDEVIIGALELAEVISPGDEPEEPLKISTSIALNRLVKSLQTDSIRLWTTELKTKTFFASNEVTGTDGLIYTCILSHVPSILNQPITGAEWEIYWKLEGETGGVWAASISNTIDVDGVAVNAGTGYVDIPIATHGLTTERIRISGSEYYDGDYEIVSIPDVNNVRIAVKYMAETFTGQEIVGSVYTAIGDFLLPKDILAIDRAFIRNDGKDRECEAMDLHEYMPISDKGSTGLPDAYIFNYSLEPRIMLYPQPDDVTYVFQYLAIKKLEDFDAGSDSVDFPAHWIEPLTFELAYKLLFIHGGTREKREALFLEANRTKRQAKDWDNRVALSGNKVVRPSEAHK